MDGSKVVIKLLGAQVKEPNQVAIHLNVDGDESTIFHRARHPERYAEDITSTPIKVFDSSNMGDLVDTFTYAIVHDFTE